MFVIKKPVSSILRTIKFNINLRDKFLIIDDPKDYTKLVFNSEGKCKIFEHQGGEHTLRQLTRATSIITILNTLLSTMENSNPIFGGWIMVSFNMCMVLGYLSIFALNSLSQRIVNKMHIHNNLRFIDVEFFSAFWVMIRQHRNQRSKPFTYQSSRFTKFEISSLGNVWINTQKNEFKSIEDYEKILDNIFRGIDLAPQLSKTRTKKIQNGLQANNKSTQDVQMLTLCRQLQEFKGYKLHCLIRGTQTGDDIDAIVWQRAVGCGNRKINFSPYNIYMIPLKRSNESFQEGGNLFLQMKLLKLQASGTALGPVRIAVYKGLEKLDETTTFNLQANSQLVIDESILNFHVRNFEKKKNITFNIVLQSVDNSPQELGMFDIQANNFILPFMKEGVNTFARTDFLTQGVQLEYMLFIEKTKSEVLRSMKSYEESKQSLRDLGNGNEWTITSPGMSEKQSKLVAKVEVSQQLGKHSSPKPKKFPKPTHFITASQEDNLENLSKVSNLQIQQRSNKVWYQMQDGEEKVNNLIPRRQSNNEPPAVRSRMTLNLKIVGGLAVLGIVVYLIVLLDDMNYGMDLVRGIIEDEIRSSHL